MSDCVMGGLSVVIICQMTLCMRDRSVVIMSDDIIYGWPECRYMSDGVMGGLSVVICQMTLYMRGRSVVIMSDDVIIYGWPECRYMPDGVMGGLSVVIIYGR